MPIADRNTKRFTAARTRAGEWQIVVSNAAFATYHTASSLSGILVGGALPNASFFTRWTQSILFTFTSTANLTATFRVVAENIFGESQAETISFTGASPQTAQTLGAYRRITSVTALTTSAGFNVADTLQAGYTNVNPILPLLAKLKATGNKASADINPAGSVLSVKCVGNTPDSGQPTFTITRDPYWTINITGTLTGQTSIGSLVLVRLSEGAAVDPLL